MANKLSGVNEICEHTRMSESTIMDWIFHRGFPAKKVNGVWEAQAGQVDVWMDKFKTGEPTIPAEKMKSK